MLNGFGNYLTQLRSGNAKVYGETAFNIVSLVVGGAEIKSAVSIAKASEVESVFSKIGVFTKALGKASLENGKSLLTMPERAVDNIGNKLTDIRELLGGKDLNYAFAHAGEGRSVLNVVGKTADDLPRNGVRVVFSEFGDVPYNHERIMLQDESLAFRSADGSVIRKFSYMDDAGDIKWPPANGFEVDSAGNAITHDANFQAGQVIDRYGSPEGRFTTLVENGTPASYDFRGLPYPEEMQTYHQYRVTQDINHESVQQAYNNLKPKVREDLDDAMTKFDFSLDDIANPQQGQIADVFDSGGGTQIKLATSADWYEQLGLIKEIK